MISSPRRWLPKALAFAMAASVCAVRGAAQEVELPRAAAESGAEGAVRAAAPVPAQAGTTLSFSVPSLSAAAPTLNANGAAPRPATLPAPAALSAPAREAAPASAAPALRDSKGISLSASLPDQAPSPLSAAEAASAPAPAAAPAPGADRSAAEGARRGSRSWTFAVASARALLSGRSAEPEPESAVGGQDGARRASGLQASPPAGSPRRVPAAAKSLSEGRIPGKKPFMAGTFVYNLATSVMLVVQQALFFTLAQQDQLARGVPAAQAGLHAAGVVFVLATVTGAMRIPGNSLGAWLSTRTDQRNLSLISSGSRAAVLAAVGGLVLFHQITLPVAAVLYSADWLIGGLEEVSRNTQTLALVKPGSHEFKSWSTLSQFLAQLTGLFGPLFVIVLAQFKSLAAAGHVLAPLLFCAAAGFYALIPRDAFLRAAGAAPEEKGPRLAKWRDFLGDRNMLLPVLALALTSTLLLKGPLSLNMASLLLGKGGASLVTYSALLSGLFGAGLGAGSWLAHVSDAGKPRQRSTAQWLALGALGTAALAASWTFGLWPALVLPAIASAWFFFALSNAACQSLMSHRLQESAAAGPDKKYVVGLSLTLSNVVITALRVLAGAIFFLAAKNWQTAFGLFGGLLLLVALGQWLVSRALTKGTAHVP